MTFIKLMAEYQCFPLWMVGVSPDYTGDVDPSTLPMSHEIQGDLLNWAKMFEDTFEANDPIESGFKNEVDQRRFTLIGLDLADRLQRELGPDYIILNYLKENYALRKKIAIAFSSALNSDLISCLEDVQRDFKNEATITLIPLSVFISEWNKYLIHCNAIFHKTPSSIVYIEVRSDVEHSAGSTPPRLVELLTTVLASWRGIVFDEWTDHAWTIDQIISEHMVDGHPFFDRDGWLK